MNIAEPSFPAHITFKYLTASDGYSVFTDDIKSETGQWGLINLMPMALPMLMPLLYDDLLIQISDLEYQHNIKVNVCKI